MSRDNMLMYVDIIPIRIPRDNVQWLGHGHGHF